MNKLLTFYSESHIEIYDNYFYPSYDKYLSKKYKLIPCLISQICPSGEFASLGFDDVMFKKIELIIENIDLNDNNFLVFSDCDVQFFSELEFDIENYDILFQEDYKNYKCAGFFICKQTQKILDFFSLVKNEFKKIKNGKIDDQYVINQLLKESNINLNYKFLPSDKYWTVGNSTYGKVWDGQDITVPNDLIMHHANFTIGIKNKINILNLVKKINEK
jgi:hypothetical protein